MKNIDKGIIVFLSICVLIAFCANIESGLRIIGFLALVCYGIFVLFHLALFAPMFFLVMIPNEKIENTIMYQKLNNKSIIFSFLLKVLIIAPILFCAYIVYPIFFTMLMVQTTDIDYAIELIKATNGNNH